MSRPPFSALAPAKVNLSLRLTGRRDDGYHLLDSITVFTDFGDLVSVAPSDQLSLTVNGPFAKDIPCDDGNLVLKAAHALLAESGRSAGAAITLTKSLPAAGGIGGGSSDAAVAMRLLNQLWETDLSPSDLARIGLTLGADLPVCLRGTACRMQGIGEVLADIPSLPDCGILLVNPGAACETPAVFKARTGGFSTAPLGFVPGDTAQSLARALSPHTNDLTQAAETVCPPVHEVLDALAALPNALLTRMSGSGATCFALFANETLAREAETEILRPAWWAKAGSLAR